MPAFDRELNAFDPDLAAISSRIECDDGASQRPQPMSAPTPEDPSDQVVTHDPRNARRFTEAQMEWEALPLFFSETKEGTLHHQLHQARFDVLVAELDIALASLYGPGGTECNNTQPTLANYPVGWSLMDAHILFLMASPFGQATMDDELKAKISNVLSAIRVIIPDFTDHVCMHRPCSICKVLDQWGEKRDDQSPVPATPELLSVPTTPAALLLADATDDEASPSRPRSVAAEGYEAVPITIGTKGPGRGVLEHPPHHGRAMELLGDLELAQTALAAGNAVFHPNSDDAKYLPPGWSPWDIELLGIISHKGGLSLDPSTKSKIQGLLKGIKHMAMSQPDDSQTESQPSLSV